MIATHFALGDSLLNQTMNIGHVRTKRETVTIALKEFIVKYIRVTPIALLYCGVFFTAHGIDMNYPYVHKKKIIHHGWDHPSAKYVSDNIASMEEECPYFDGLWFSPSNSLCYLLDPSLWRQDKLDWNSLNTIAWNRFTDNFILILCSDRFNVEWFNDAHWDNIVSNMEMTAKAAKVSGCKGVVFDAEAYSTRKPWRYSDHAEGHTREEVEAKMRQRGGQVMAAWQREFPGLRIMSTFLYYPFSKNYEMLPSFVNGLLDSAGPDVKLYDGYEYSFYLTNTNQWFEVHDKIRNEFKEQYTELENRAKWQTQVSACHTPYIDICYGQYPDGDLRFSAANKKRLEHNVFMGLAACDEYIWLYNEEMAFWNNTINSRPLGMTITSEEPWPGVVEAIISARQKYESGQPLGWDLCGLDSVVVDTSVEVQITSPAHGSEYSTIPAGFTVSAVASGGTIKHIDFYINASKVGTDSVSPFQFQVSDLAKGEYTIMARAVNSDGSHGTSGPVDITVAYPATSISRMQVPEHRDKPAIRKHHGIFSVFIPGGTSQQVDIFNLVGRQIASFNASGPSRRHRVPGNSFLSSVVLIIIRDSSKGTAVAHLVNVR